MNSPDVAVAQHAGAPDAAGQLYDAHAPHGVTRMIVTQGQGAHQAVVLSVPPSPASGELAAGHSATVTVTVQRQSGSGGSATVQINGAQVPVTWAPTATPGDAPSGGFDPSGLGWGP